MQQHALTLFLIGPRGSGKTTVGRLVAEALGLPFYDTDDMVMAEAGLSIADIVAAEGWAAFRKRESRALAEAVARAAGPAPAHSGRSPSGAVISTGGGMVLDERNRAFMMNQHGLGKRLVGIFSHDRVHHFLLHIIDNAIDFLLGCHTICHRLIRVRGVLNQLHGKPIL